MKSKTKKYPKNKRQFGKIKLLSTSKVIKPLKSVTPQQEETKKINRIFNPKVLIVDEGQRLYNLELDKTSKKSLCLNNPVPDLSSELLDETRIEVQDLEEQLLKKCIENEYLKERIKWLESRLREIATGEK